MPRKKKYKFEIGTPVTLSEGKTGRISSRRTFNKRQFYRISLEDGGLVSRTENSITERSS